MRVCAGAEDKEDDIARRDLDPFLDRHLPEDRDLHDGVEVGAVDYVPVVGVFDSAAEAEKDPESVGKVDQYDKDANGEEAQEAGFGRVTCGDEAVEFSAVAVETVDEKCCFVVSVSLMNLWRV